MPRDTVGLEILHRHDHHIPVAIRDTAHMAPPTIITRLEKLRFHSMFRSEVSHDPIITPVAVGLDPNGVPPVPAAANVIGVWDWLRCYSAIG